MDLIFDQLLNPHKTVRNLSDHRQIGMTTYYGIKIQKFKKCEQVLGYALCLISDLSSGRGHIFLSIFCLKILFQPIIFQLSNGLNGQIGHLALRPVDHHPSRQGMIIQRKYKVFHKAFILILVTRNPASRASKRVRLVAMYIE